MVRWRNLGVRPKLLVVAAVAGLATVGTGLVGVVQLRSVASTAGDIATNRMRQALNVEEARAALLREDSTLLGYPFLTDDVSHRQAEADMRASDKIFDQGWTAYESHSRGRTGTNQVIDVSIAFYRNLRDTQMLPAAQRNDPVAFRDARVQQADVLTVMTENLDRIAGLESGRVVAGGRDIQRAQRDSTRVLLAVLVVGLLAAGTIALLVAAAIVRPVRRVEQALAAMARGDLTASADVDSTDEIGRMAAGFEDARTAMCETVGALRDAAERVTEASEQVLRSDTRIGASTSAAAEQVTHVTTAADLVSSRVQTLAAGAENTSAAMRSIAEAATRAAQVASEAVAVVDDTTETMAELGESSARIGEVVKVITGIAEQTNLLALNATIESARAGELGKGFAVVAGEVKDLARETASATEDIARRVQAIQASSVGAVKAIGDISRIIGEINNQQATIAGAVEQQTSTTNEMNRDIVAAASGSREIGESIGVMGDSVRTAAQDSEAARATADNLIFTAQRLREAVQRFRA